MKIISEIEDLQSLRTEMEGFVGLVPTMGALHAGHLSLIEKSKQSNANTILSIFVNPTQFNNPDDFANYPKTIEADLQMAEKAGVEFVFLPQKDSLYPEGYNYKMTEIKDATVLEGAHRPGHFDGVLTIVLKLFMITQPHRAYFGEKDYQQLILIEGLVANLFLPIEVVRVPTLREESGLAMSSRNMRLSESARAQASQLFQALVDTKYSLDEKKAKLAAQGFEVEYLEEKWGRRLIAAQLNGVRLIDNVKI
jgi:pantoate--beta-alanine ligase